jgi:hypothetical protein
MIALLLAAVWRTPLVGGIPTGAREEREDAEIATSCGGNAGLGAGSELATGRVAAWLACRRHVSVSISWLG